LFFLPPTPPITDEIGIDFFYSIYQTISADPSISSRLNGGNISVLEKLIEQKMLGKKTGRGFYIYKDERATGKVNANANGANAGGKKKRREVNGAALIDLAEVRKSVLLGEDLKQTDSGASRGPVGNVAQEYIQMRLISRYINEAAYCLQEGIIRAPADGKTRPCCHYKTNISS
jgi:enoyl-CoA hydratase/long-chain 3-hydroxyacyl-CoA dehydrogenase